MKSKNNKIMETGKINFNEIKMLIPKFVNLYYVDYRDILPQELIKMLENVILKKDLSELYDNVYEFFNVDESINYYLDNLKNDIVNRYNISSEEAEEIIEKYKDDIVSILFERDDSDPLKELAKNTLDIHVRIRLYNDELISSGYTIQKYGINYETIKNELRFLRINPKTFKKVAEKRDIKVSNCPNIPSRNGKEIVNIENFVNELLETTSEANMLTILCKIDVLELIENFKFKKIVIPAGNKVGLFDSFNGAGSIFDCVLKQNLTLSIPNKKFEVEVLFDEFHGYSLDYCYGVLDEFWGKTIDLKK